MKQDVDYYMAHPNEIPDDPEVMKEFLDQINSAAVDAVPPKEEPGDKKDGGATDAVAVEGKKDEWVDGVQARDGKNILPFGVLQGARDRAEAAERLVAERAERIAELERQLASGAASKDAAPGAVEVESDDSEAVAFIENELPEVKRLFDRQAAVIARLEASVADLKGSAGAASERNQRNEIQEAIDLNPKLAFIQASNQDLFDAAIRADEMLKVDPKFIGVPLSDRFAKAVAIVEATHGSIDLPGVKRPGAETANPSPYRAPTSLSEMTGGAMVETGMRESLEKMSGADITAFLADKTPEQILDFLAKHG